jgi:hypothetical protein
VPPPPSVPVPSSPTPAGGVLGTSVSQAANGLGGLSLGRTSSAVKSGRIALVKIACTGVYECEGKLTLSAKERIGKGHRKTTRTVVIGTASFSLGGATTTTVKVSLDAAGRALLAAAQGHLGADLTILELAPGEGSPSKTDSVQLLAPVKANRAKRRA